MKTLFLFAVYASLSLMSITPIHATGDRPINGADPCGQFLVGGSLTIGEESQMARKSNMMDALYGVDVADKVYNRLQELDPVLNHEIQRVAYDHYWARPGLSTRDKSLVTVSSLIAMGKEEQTRIHMNGFLNSSGSIEALKFTLIHLAVFSSREAAMNGKMALTDVLKERGIAQSDIDQLASELDMLFKSVRTTEDAWNLPGLELRDKNLLNLSAAVAIGKQKKTVAAIRRFLADGGLLEDLKNTMIHQIVYCGFPAAMNGFAAHQTATLKQPK